MGKVTNRHWILVGILLSVLCLAYFYMLDRVIFSSAKFSPIFQLLVAVYDNQAAWLVVVGSLLAAIWNKPAPIVKLVGAIGRHPVATALTSVILLSAGALVVYHNHPLAMDEYAPVFQSKVFAMGRIAARFSPQLVNWLVMPGFNGVFLIASPHTGQVIEAYWPGFALLLAPFQWIGAPWLCNPMLAGIALYLIFRITLDITGDRRAAGFALLFALASGAFVANAISYYSMQAHLTANLLFAWLLMSPNRARALAAGAVGSLALVLHNPVPHALFALPWLIAMLWDKERRRYLPPLVLGYLPLSIVLGLGWIMLRHQIAADMPGGAVIGGAVAAIFRWPNAAMLNMRVAALAKMWVWAAPCLFLFAFIGGARHWKSRHVRLLVQSAILTFVGYLFVNLDQGHGWGYRYFHSAWGVVPILAGCAITGESADSERLVSFAGAAAVLGLLVIMPFQLSQIDGFIARYLAQVPPARRPGNNIYFIKPGAGFYMSDMVQSDPGLRTQDLLLVSHGLQQDSVFVRRYWPSAVKVSFGYWGDQWYLGPIDQRAQVGGNMWERRFVFTPASTIQSR